MPAGKRDIENLPSPECLNTSSVDSAALDWLGRLVDALGAVKETVDEIEESFTSSDDYGVFYSYDNELSQDSRFTFRPDTGRLTVPGMYLGSFAGIFPFQIQPQPLCTTANLSLGAFEFGEQVSGGDISVPFFHTIWTDTPDALYRYRIAYSEHRLNSDEYDYDDSESDWGIVFGLAPHGLLTQDSECFLRVDEGEESLHVPRLTLDGGLLASPSADNENTIEADGTDLFYIDSTGARKTATLAAQWADGGGYLYPASGKAYRVAIGGTADPGAGTTLQVGNSADDYGHIKIVGKNTGNYYAQLSMVYHSTPNTSYIRGFYQNSSGTNRVQIGGDNTQLDIILGGSTTYWTFTTTNGALTPGNDLAYDIGAGGGGKKVRAVYSEKVSGDDGGGSGILYLKAGTQSGENGWYIDQAPSHGDFVPGITGAQNIGNSSSKVGSIYMAASLYANGSAGTSSQVLQGGNPAQWTNKSGLSVADSAALGGKTWAAPDPIGTATPAAGTFTQLNLPGDTYKLYMGGSSDASMYYDGTDMNIDCSLIAASDLLIECGANKTIELQHTVFDDVRISATTTKLAGSKDPGFSLFRNDGGGPASQGVFAYMFDKASEEEVYFTVQFPHTKKNSSNILPHIHWSPMDTDTGAVRWGIEYTWVDVDGTFGTTTIIYASDAGDGTAYKHQVCSFSAITGSGVTGVSSMLVGRVFRDAGDGTDTYDNDAALLELDFHIEVNTMGSRQEWTK